MQIPDEGPRAFLLTAILCLSTSTAAEDGNALDEIIVTATRLESSIRELPRSASIVDKARIQDATQQLALDEALAGTPGLYMQNRYNFAQDLRISLRGFRCGSSSVWNAPTTGCCSRSTDCTRCASSSKPPSALGVPE